MHKIWDSAFKFGIQRSMEFFILAATREYHGTFRRPSSASRTKMAPAETPNVIMTLVSYICSLPRVPRKARKHWHYWAGFALKVTVSRNNLTALFADAAR